MRISAMVMTGDLTLSSELLYFSKDQDRGFDADLSNFIQGPKLPYQDEFVDS